MRRTIIAAVAAYAASCLIALAGNTVFPTNIGDLTFPFSPPTAAGAPGAIDNMVIGATTPVAATFSTVKNAGLGVQTQGAPAAKTVAVTLTAAELTGGLITANQGGGAAAAYTLPLATAVDSARTWANNDSFDFTVINISVTAAEVITMTTNTGWTLVGNMTVAANNAVTTISSATFRARRTGAGAWVLYRLS